MMGSELAECSAKARPAALRPVLEGVQSDLESGRYRVPAVGSPSHADEPRPSRRTIRNVPAWSAGAETAPGLVAAGS